MALLFYGDISLTMGSYKDPRGV